MHDLEITSEGTISKVNLLIKTPWRTRCLGYSECSDAETGSFPSMLVHIYGRHFYFDSKLREVNGDGNHVLNSKHIY